MPVDARTERNQARPRDSRKAPDQCHDESVTVTFAALTTVTGIVTPLNGRTSPILASSVDDDSVDPDRPKTLAT